MELLVQILLSVIGLLFVSLIIFEKIYNELKEDYKELAIQYFTDVFEEKEEKED